jgi:hypothetical protein
MVLVGENKKETDHLEDLSLNLKDNITWDPIQRECGDLHCSTTNGGVL